MKIFCIGINHRTAPIDIRERMWFSNDEIKTALPVLRENHLQEAVLVSTCNRTELYYVPRPQGLNGEPLWHALATFKHAEPFVTEQHFYSHDAHDAVEHIFSVASGIDSMILGDVQILSQMKDAYSIAQESHSTDILLNRLFPAAFHTGKRVRTETEIGEGAVSISYAAAELATKIFEDLSKRTALLIGAGETGKLTAKHLMGKNLGNLLLANRTRTRAEELVGHLGGHVIDFHNLLPELPRVDIIISAVESPSFVLSQNEIRQAMKLRGNKPLFIIDIGVPRNIDPLANTIENVFLNDIDALNHIVDKNLAHRQDEVPKIQKIVAEETTFFTAWHDSLDVTPTIQQLREQFETIRQSELEKHLHHFPVEAREELELLTKRIVNKILHTPMVNLKNQTTEQPEGDTQKKVFILRHLFGLDKKHRS
jgi:glutamyl-tRNA reductase